MTEIKIDLKGVRGPQDLHQRIAEALCAPDYYGYNLDALYDLLTEMSESAKICFVNTGDAWQIMPGTCTRLQRVCRDAAEENEDIAIVM